MAAAAADIEWRWIAPRLVLAVIGGYLAFRWGALIATGHVRALWLKDYELYMDATRGWLAGGPFYPDWQTSGPYDIRWGAILYPPVALVLFAPFSFLPGWLWIAIPFGVTLAVIVSHRPGLWRLAAMAVVLAGNPLEILDYTAGTPTIWVVMFVALATRWPWWSALVLAKPTLRRVRAARRAVTLVVARRPRPVDGQPGPVAHDHDLVRGDARPARREPALLGAQRRARRAAAHRGLADPAAARREA